MATAAFKLNKCTGTNAATETDCNWAPKFLAVDSATTPPSSAPIGVPKDAGSSPGYSYECWLRLECTAAPNNAVENIKFYGPPYQPDYNESPPNRLFIMAGTTATGATPVTSASSVAVTHQAANYVGTGVGEYLAIGVEPEDDKINAVGEKSDYLVLQLKVLDQAQRGSMIEVPLNFSYDES